MGGIPTVSVCVPTFNRARYLRQCLDSILRQTFGDFEVVVVDNASTDETPAVVAEFEDPRLRYHRNPANLGQIRNINQALTLASAEYVSICHDDDLYTPTILEREVQVLSEHPEVVMVHSAVWLLSDSGEIRGIHRINREGYIMRGREAFFRYLALGHDVVFSTVMARRVGYERVGGFDPAYLCADFQMWLKLSLYGDVAYLAEPLAGYRIHSSSATSEMNAARWFREYFEIFDRAVEAGRTDIPDLASHSGELRARARRHQARRARIEAASCIAAGNYNAAVQYIGSAKEMDPSLTGTVMDGVLSLSANPLGRTLLAGFRAVRRRLKMWCFPGGPRGYPVCPSGGPPSSLSVDARG